MWVLRAISPLIGSSYSLFALFVSLRIVEDMSGRFAINVRSSVQLFYLPGI